MAKELWTIKETIALVEVDEAFISVLEREEIVCPTCGEADATKRFPLAEIEKIRLAKVLMEEMGVNLEGVEVILRMRSDMQEMCRQFDTILQDLASQVRLTLQNRDRHLDPLSK